MTGRWQCQGCQQAEVKTQLIGVGGGLKEARKLTCADCGESDYYTLNLIGKETPAKTERGKFQWTKGSTEEAKR